MKVVLIIVDKGADPAEIGKNNADEAEVIIGDEGEVLLFIFGLLSHKYRYQILN